jgi:hypothetical protein
LPADAGGVFARSTDTITTWTVGGGIEWAIYNNWSIKGEYMFIGSGHGLTTCGFAADPNGAAVAGGQFCFNHAFPGIHTAKFGSRTSAAIFSAQLMQTPARSIPRPVQLQLDL